jgi:hypothetical protein
MREGRSEHLVWEQPGEVHCQAHRYMVQSRIVRMTEEDCCRRIEGGCTCGAKTTLTSNFQLPVHVIPHTVIQE